VRDALPRPSHPPARLMKRTARGRPVSAVRVLTARERRDSGRETSLTLSRSLSLFALCLIAGKADPILTMSHVDRGYNPGSTKPNAAFNSEVKAACFMYLDRFIVLASGAKLYLYKYELAPDDRGNDLARLQATLNRYKLVSSFTCSAQAVCARPMPQPDPRACPLGGQGVLVGYLVYGRHWHTGLVIHLTRPLLRWMLETACMLTRPDVCVPSHGPSRAFGCHQLPQRSSTLSLGDRMVWRGWQVTAVAAANGFLSNVVLCAGSNRAVEVLDLAAGRWVRALDDTHARPAHSLVLHAATPYASHAHEVRARCCPPPNSSSV
jgi:hypothetical protein